jgi:hypothetical protein
MDKFDLAIFIAIANVSASCLPIVEVRARMCLAITILAGDPAFEIVHTNLAITHVASTDVDDTVGQFQGLYQFLCIAEQRFKPAYRLLVIGFTDDILFDFIELVNAEDPACIFSIGTCLLTETGTIGNKF